jgi:hypothetical protein
MPTRRDSPSGTLGLMASGRVEVTLDDGKRLFSVPAALTKRRYEPLSLRATFVVGPRVYTLIFRTEGVGTGQFTAWRRAIEDCAVLSTDDLPILAAATPDSYAAHAALARKGFRLRAVLGIGGTCLGVAAVAGLQALNASDAVIKSGIAVVAVALFFSGFVGLRLIFAPRPPASANEIAVGAEDTFPAGTLPTGRPNPSVLQYAVWLAIAMAVALATFFYYVNTHNLL